MCIELNGLRLNRPRLPGELAHWLPSPGQRSAELDRKFRVDVPVVRVRSEVSGGWGDPTSVRRDGSRGETNQNNGINETINNHSLGICHIVMSSIQEVIIQLFTVTTLYEGGFYFEGSAVHSELC